MSDKRKKVLFVATLGSHIALFHMGLINYLKENGYVCDAAFKDDSDTRPNLDYSGLNKIHDVYFARNPWGRSNFAAYKKLKKIIIEGGYDIIHCNTPVGGVLARLAAGKLRTQGNLKVIYTAHGFHFFKGAPKLNWLLYYPVEWLMSFKTDVLVTINKEDYSRAKQHMHAKRVEYVPGVGIDIEKFNNVCVNKSALMKQFDIPEDATVLLSVGELNKNKNHRAVIQALAEINNTDDKKNLHYLVCGEGPLKNELKQLAQELNISDRVHLIGFNDQVERVYKIADLYVQASFREGLPVALMEAMASGLPCVAYNIRGCSDLLKPENLASFKPNNLKDKILEALQNPEQNKQNFAVDIYMLDKSTVNRQMLNIYTNIND